jgi:hypothetical protein
MRLFRGGYTPDANRLLERKYVIAKPVKALITSLNEDQGAGTVEGITQKMGQVCPDVEISIYKRSDKTLLWTTTSDQNGKYKMRNLALGLECFVIAFDPNNQYNAVIQDKVVAK